MNEDVGILEDTGHLFGIGHEVRREIPLVDLHPFDPVHCGIESLALFHGDDPILADLLHRIGDDGANRRIIIGSDGSDLSDLFLVFHLGGHIAQFLGDFINSLLDSTLQTHRIRTCCDIAQTFIEDRTGEDSSRGGAVSGVVGSSQRNFLHHLSSHVFERILEFNFTRHGNTILGDSGCAKRLLENNVTASGAERDHDSSCEFLYATAYSVAGFVVKRDALCAHRVSSSHIFCLPQVSTRRKTRFIVNT